MHVVLTQRVRPALWGNAPPSEHFLDERVNVWQRLTVCERRDAVAKDGVELRLRTCLSFRVERHREEECIYRRDGLHAMSGRGEKIGWL